MVRHGVIVMAVFATLLWMCGAAVAPQEEAREKPVTKVYDVRDLIMPVPDYVAPTLDFPHGIYRETEPGEPPGGLFADVEDVEEEPLTAEESLHDLIELTTQVVEPGTWEEGTGHAIRGRQGMIVVTHTAATQTKVETLLNSLRKKQSKMVSVHVSFVQPTAAAMDQIMKEKRLLAVTAAERAALSALVGPKLCEAKLLAMDGQQVYVTAGETTEFLRRVEKEVTIETLNSVTIAWARPVVTESDTVMLNMGASFARLIPQKQTNVAPTQKCLTVRGTYRIPDGGMLLTSGGTLMDKDPREVYALIQVQVIAPKEAKVRGK